MNGEPTSLLKDENEDRASRWTASARYRFFVRAFFVGVLAHLTLPDAWVLSWMAPNALLLGGAWLLITSKRPKTHRVGWLLCFVGVSWPLLWLGDQLTQSTYMALTAIAGMWFVQRERAFFQAIRLLTLAIYACAVFHKLNHDFFDPAVSCASGGMDLLMTGWSLPALPNSLRPFWPPLFILTESSLVVFLIWRPRWGVALAALMHIPLTIIFAPAFAWVVAPGWISFWTDAEQAAFVHHVRTHKRRILIVGLLLGGTSAALYFRTHWVVYPPWQIKELLLWVLTTSIVSFEFSQRGTPKKQPRKVWQESRAMGAWVLFAAFMLNAATPYSGLQFHHAGAMLSNLRIDEGCWNHLIVPELVRIQDPYIRVERAQVEDREDRQGRLHAMLMDKLWHPADLERTLSRACAHSTTSLSMTFEYDGQIFDVENACEGLPLSAQRAGLFQTNLMRACPQECAH